MAAAVSYAIGFAIILGFSPKGIPHRSVLLSLVLLGVLASAASANLALGAFDQKLASELSFALWSGAPISTNPTFLPQMVVNSPVYFLLDTWEACIGTNAALVALAFLFAHMRSPKAAMHLLAPAVCNFALFGLRDPLLGVLMMVFAYALLIRDRPRFTVTTLTVVAGVMYWARPENLSIMAAGIAAVVLLRRTDFGLRMFLTPALAVAAAIGARLSLPLIGIRIGGSIFSAPLSLLEFSYQRGRRYQGVEGGGSNILGGAVVRLAAPLSFLVRLLATVVLPLPFEIRTLTLALAFTDSLFLFWIGRRFFNESSREARVLILIYVLVVAFFATNYGNVFRLRMPLHFMMAGAALAELARPDRVDEDEVVAPRQVATDVSPVAVASAT